MTRGRKPKPKRLHAVEGTYRGDRHDRGLDLPGGAPPEPSWARTFPARKGGDKTVTRMREDARAEWRRVVPELARLGLLSHIDRGLMLDYCVAWAMLEDARRLVSVEGRILTETVTRKNGDTYTIRYRHPALITMAEQRQFIKHACSEFGLGVSSRGRLNVTPRDPDEEDEQDVFGS